MRRPRACSRRTGAECGPNEKGVLTVKPSLPLGCLTTVWGDDARFLDSYFGQFEQALLYSSSDWALRADQARLEATPVQDFMALWAA